MAETMAGHVQVFADLEALSEAAAASFADLAHEAITARGRCSVALSGGSTPRRLFELLAVRPLRWDRIHLFWGDERCVAPTDPQSNYHMAFETLISKVRIPAQNVHRIRAEVDSPDQAASAYEQELRSFHRQDDGDSVFTFDLILLGLGDDGHTASLFPGNPALEEMQRWVVAVSAPPAYATRQRISFTLPLIDHGRRVWFLVAGAAKTGVVQAILQRPGDARQIYPAARVNSRGGPLWYLDRAAYGAQE